MTRWWAYAILAIALVCSGVTAHDAMVRVGGACELTEATVPAAAAAKRGGKPSNSARRSASTCTAVIVAAGIELAPPRSWIIDEVVLEMHRAERVVVVATARAPPV